MYKRSKNLRVAILSCFSDPLAPVGGREVGGVSIYVYELVKSLSKLGIAADVFVRWDNRKADEVAKLCKRGRVIRLKAGPRRFIPQEEIDTYTPEFIEHFLSFGRGKNLRYDLIHSHQYISGRIGIQLKEILKIPLIHTFHSLGKVKEQSKISSGVAYERFDIEKRIMDKANLIIATSPQEKHNIINLYNVDGENVSVIPVGVNLKRFSKINRKQIRKELVLGLGKKIVLFAGRMDENKGALTLIDAVKQIKDRYQTTYDDLELLIFSGDPRKTRRKEAIEARFRKKLTLRIANKEIGNKVKLFPAVDQEKLHKYYAASNLVVIPSYYESFGMVAIEAGATGVPVVASDTGGLQWVVQEGITGFHADVGSGKDFAKKMVSILEDEDIQRRMGENANVIASRKFDWNVIAKKITEHYYKEISQL